MGKEGEKESTERKTSFLQRLVILSTAEICPDKLRRKTSVSRAVALTVLLPGALLQDGQWDSASAAALSPGWWEGGRAHMGRVRRKAERSLVGMETESPCSQAHTLTVAHGASQMLAALASSKAQLHLSPECV